MKPSFGLQGSSTEIKFRVPLPNSPLVEELLVAFLRPHATIPIGHVNSIYYDTENLDSFYEKVDGDYEKTRFRLRWYDPAGDHSGNDDLYVQIKRRLGNRRIKKNLLAVEKKQQADCASLDSIELGVLADYFVRLDPFYAPRLLPVVRTRYLRRRFQDPCSGAEICLDRDIELMAIHPRLGSLDPTNGLGFDIMEIKLPGGAPPSHVEKLVRDVAYPEAISKYAAAMQCRLNR